MVPRGPAADQGRRPARPRRGAHSSRTQRTAYFHSKFGILTDPTGDKVAWIGSDNETANGWLKNHETFAVAKSWLAARCGPSRGSRLVARFEQHWDEHPTRPGWTIRTWPTSTTGSSRSPRRTTSRRTTDPIWDLLGIPDRPPGRTTRAGPGRGRGVALDSRGLAELPAVDPYTAALTAPAVPLPHQTSILATAVVDTYPRGYLFADPVGFGKTLETRVHDPRADAVGPGEDALLLVPASVMTQWQEELAEKLGLFVPRYDGRSSSTTAATPVAPPRTQPVVGVPDRAGVLAPGPPRLPPAADPGRRAVGHRRRRRGPPRPPPRLQAHRHPQRAARPAAARCSEQGSWKALYLATATPMQMHPHEAWDLLALLDLPGRWGSSAATSSPTTSSCG